MLEVTADIAPPLRSDRVWQARRRVRPAWNETEAEPSEDMHGRGVDALLWGTQRGDSASARGDPRVSNGDRLRVHPPLADAARGARDDAV